MFNLKNTLYTGVLVAAGVLLPLLFHVLPFSSFAMLPMHLPVLLCGIICGAPYGIIAGILTPLLSSVITGMPPQPMVLPMVIELAAYGLIAGLIYSLVKTRNLMANVYIALIGAMLGGRIVYGIMSALFFSAGEYSMQAWVTSMFVTAIPGIITQLILVPAVVYALDKAKLVNQVTRQTP